MKKITNLSRICVSYIWFSVIVSVVSADQSIINIFPFTWIYELNKSCRRYIFYSHLWLPLLDQLSWNVKRDYLVFNSYLRHHIPRIFQRVFSQNYACASTPSTPSSSVAWCQQRRVEKVRVCGYMNRAGPSTKRNFQYGWTF